MKNILLFTLILIIGLSSFSCKKENKEAPKAKYSIETKTTTINWTAYKTTAKVPVKGIFKEVQVNNTKSAENPYDVLNGLTFSIPVNSIDTKNVDRDSKIIQSFFGTMKDTKVLKGTIHLGEKGKGNIDLTMNGITAKLPMIYTVSGQLAEINATLSLDNWQAKLAIDALNTVCKDKHKGEDGVSKTWNEVTIQIISYLKVD